MTALEIVVTIILGIIFTILFYRGEIKSIKKIIVFDGKIKALSKDIKHMGTAEIQMLIDSNNRFDTKLDLIIEKQHFQDLQINDLKKDVNLLQVDVSAIKSKKGIGTDGLTISLKWQVLQKILLYVGSGGGLLAALYQGFKGILQ